MLADGMSGTASAAGFDCRARPAPGARVAATVDGVKIDGDRGERYLVVARAAETPSGPVVVYGVSTLRGADRAVRALKVASVIGIPTLVLLAGLFAWRAVRRGLAPVAGMRAGGDEVEANGPGPRLAPPPRPAEIAPAPPGGAGGAAPEGGAGPVAPAGGVPPAPLTGRAAPDLIPRGLRTLLTTAARHARSEIAVDVGADVVAGMGAAGGVAWVRVA